MNKGNICIIGAGGTGVKIISALLASWRVIVLDLRREALDNVSKKYPEVELTTVRGDATSYLVLKNINVQSCVQIIVCIGNDELSYEIARLLCNRFKFRNVVFHLKDHTYEKKIEVLNHKVVVTSDIMVNALLNVTTIGYRLGLYVGKGSGEIIQLHLTSSSPLIDKPLKSLKANKSWIIGAIYRSRGLRSRITDSEVSFLNKLNVSKKDRLIIPKGNTILRAGDKILLIGDPSILQSMILYLKVGGPKFPRKYGLYILLCLFEYEKNLSFWFQVNWIIRRIYLEGTRFILSDKECSSDSLETVSSFLKSEIPQLNLKNSFFSSLKKIWKNFKKYSDTSGLLILEKPDHWFKRLIFNRLIFIGICFSFIGKQKPVWIVDNRLRHHSHSIVLVITPEESSMKTIELFFDVALQLKLPVRILQIQQLDILAGLANTKKTEDFLSFANELASLYNINLDVKIVQGNSIQETLKEVSCEELLVFSYKRRSFFNMLIPNVALSIQRKFFGHMLFLIQ